MLNDHTRTAVLIPCFNESATIAKVVHDLRAALPGAVVYVFDNNSTDGTAARAREAGAVVTLATGIREWPGEGVRGMAEERDVWVGSPSFIRDHHTASATRLDALAAA